MARRFSVSVFASVIALTAFSTSVPIHAQQRQVPTVSDEAYGPHERHVLDFYKAEADEPTPLVVYIHGGGFTNGTKSSVSQQTLRELLEAGISVAALHYRFAEQAPLPAAHEDCRRALQFLRANAKKWNIDGDRVGAFGGSAGAQLCMYLAFHDDMANPKARKPVARQSTRLACVATNGGQTTMDVSWWIEHIPGYVAPHRDFFETFGVDSQEAYLAKIPDISALNLISSDDPPIYMSYGMSPEAEIPTDEKKASGWKVHHVQFGVALKEKMDALGIEAELVYPGKKGQYDSMADFFKAKLGKEE